MKIFVSYSFRPENAWIEDHVLPLITCFGHEPVTGQVLDAGAVDEEVRRKITACRRVMCFVTRAKPVYDANGKTTGHAPPDWVRDELMLARGAKRDAIEFRERGVIYDGASPFHAYCEFDREELPRLLIDIARRISEWPVGPLQLRLMVPEQSRDDIQLAANAGTLRARCVAVDEDGIERSEEELKVHMRDGQLVVPFWVRADPSLSIEIEIILGARRLVCRGISPAVREAKLSLV